jgi:hypothetical protein
VGASWVRQHILEAHRNASLHIVVVWEPMYPGDTRADAVGDRVFADPRVTSFWDPHEISGRWLGRRAADPAQGVIVWDAFLAFPPQARWSDPPARVVAAGAPIIGGVDRLQRDFVPLLREHGASR